MLIRTREVPNVDRLIITQRDACDMEEEYDTWTDAFSYLSDLSEDVPLVDHGDRNYFHALEGVSEDELRAIMKDC